MRFKNLVEATAIPFSPPDKVLLFHGTTTAKLDKIVSQGLVVPRGNIRAYIMGRAKEFWDTELEPILKRPFPETLVAQEVEEYVVGTRFNMSGITEEDDKCLYMALNPRLATTYARYAADNYSEASIVGPSRALWVANRILQGDGYNYGDREQLNLPTPQPPEKGRPLLVLAVVPLEATTIPRHAWEYAYEQYLMGGNFLYCFQTWAWVYDAIKSKVEEEEVRVYADVPSSDVFFDGALNSGTAPTVFDPFVRRIIGY